jgi:hypothetical protein
MFEASDTSWAPWFVARSEDKKRVRLNIITHLLTQIPYEDIPDDPVEFPKRKIGKVKPTHYPFPYYSRTVLNNCFPASVITADAVAFITRLPCSAQIDFQEADLNRYRSIHRCWQMEN